MKTKTLISKLLVIAILLSLIFTLTTCKKDEKKPDEGEFVIAEQAKFINDADWNSMVVGIDSNDYLLTFNNDILDDYSLNQGDIIVSSVGNGLLRKIQNINQSGNNVIIMTTQATLTDLIQQGDIDYRSSLSLSQIKSIEYYYSGIYLDTSSVKSTNGTLFNWEINTELASQIQLQGNFQYTSDFILQLQISIIDGLKKVKFGFEGNEEFNLELLAGKQFTLSKQVTLATVHFTPILIPLPVPPFTLVVAPVLDIKLGLDGYANANITTSISQNFTIETGIQYLKTDGWSTYLNYDKEFQYTPPQLNMNAGAEVYLKPELRMLLYNVVGPYVNAKGYGKINADLTQSPWWSMYYGFKMSAGAKATILSVLLFDFSVDDLIEWEQQVGQSSTSVYTQPTVTTASITNKTQTSATSGGNVISDGGATVTARGVCWSTSTNPDIYDDHTSDGSGTSSFTSNITNLTQSTTYHVRAYATNSEGTAYGDDVEFNTLGPNPTSPTVTTASITNITQTSATSGGNVTSDGGANVTARGICWSTSALPDIYDEHTSDGSGTGPFTSSLINLNPNTTYHVRAYATNSEGTAYGDDFQFPTSSGNTELITNLISYWKLDETSGSIAYDSHGSNNCTVNSGVTINQSGLLGSSASFIVTSGGLTTGKKASELGIGGNTSKSVSIWIKPSSAIYGPNSNGIINLGSKSSQKQFGIKFYGGVGSDYWMFDSYYGSVRIGSNSDKLADGNWHHIVATYNSDGHKVRTYLDGNFITEDASKTLNTGDDYGFSIGIGSQGKFIGLIDEVGLWSRPLTDNEVQTLFNNGNGVSYPF